MDHPLDGTPEAQPVVGSRITFNAICNKSAAKILALVAMLIDGGPAVNSAAPRLPGLRVPSCRTRAKRALNEAAHACACGAREAKMDQDQAIDILRFRDRETGDNRTATAVGKGFPSSARLRTNEAAIWVHGTFGSRRSRSWPLLGHPPGSKSWVRVAAMVW